jgi:hypothetical protein
MIPTDVLQSWHAGRDRFTRHEVAADGHHPGRCGDEAHTPSNSSLCSVLNQRTLPSYSPRLSWGFPPGVPCRPRAHLS